VKFASRQDAGRRLAGFLQTRHISADVVLGLPRGGVVVAAEIARQFHLPLDVLVVRKIGHPLQREFAVGALAEPGLVFIHEESLQHDPKNEQALKNRARAYSKSGQDEKAKADRGAAAKLNPKKTPE